MSESGKSPASRARRRQRSLSPREMGRVMGILRREAPTWNAPVFISKEGGPRDPFRVLVACILSLRTKDETTGPAAERLFGLGSTPVAVHALTTRQIERAIYPVGFYRTKARTIRRLCADLLQQHGGHVPNDLDTLLKLPGVGRKTANLVVTQAFGRPGVCVDTHVHRITNRWGYVTTTTPHQTEMALRSKLPAQHWIEINGLLVALGQTICRPISPLCSTCPISAYCGRVGVRRSR